METTGVRISMNACRRVLCLALLALAACTSPTPPPPTASAVTRTPELLGMPSPAAAPSETPEQVTARPTVATSRPFRTPTPPRAAVRAETVIAMPPPITLAPLTLDAGPAPTSTPVRPDYSRLSQNELAALANQSRRLIGDGNRPNMPLPLLPELRQGANAGDRSVLLRAILLDAPYLKVFTLPAIAELEEGEVGTYEFSGYVLPLLMQDREGRYVVKNAILQADFSIAYSTNPGYRLAASQHFENRPVQELLPLLAVRTQHDLRILSETDFQRALERVKTRPERAAELRVRLAMILRYGADTLRFAQAMRIPEPTVYDAIPYLGPINAIVISTP